MHELIVSGSGRYSYGMAVCLLEIGRADNVAEASKLFEKVPELRHQIVGKFIPVEVRTATYLLANLVT